MSRICRNMGDSGKLRFYELESKMRRLKTHSHTSNGLAMEPGTREEKQLKETKTLQQGKPLIKNLPRTAGVAGGGRKGSRTCRIPAGGRKGYMANQPQKSRKGYMANQPQKRYNGEASPRRYGGEHRP